MKTPVEPVISLNGPVVIYLPLLPDHIAIQMTGASGIDLDSRDTFLGNSFSILRGLDIAFDYPDADIILESIYGPFKKAGLAGPG